MFNLLNSNILKQSTSHDTAISHKARKGGSFPYAKDSVQVHLNIVRDIIYSRDDHIVIFDL